jgi:hypothetical protein
LGDWKAGITKHTALRGIEAVQRALGEQQVLRVWYTREEQRVVDTSLEPSVCQRAARHGTLPDMELLRQEQR